MSELKQSTFVDKSFTEEAPVHACHLFTNIYHRILIVGSSGTGKTYSLRQLLPMLMTPRNLFLVTKNYDQPVYNEVRQNYSQFGTNSQVITEVSKIGESINKEALRGTKNNIAILDDLSKRELESEEVISLFTQGRHLRLNVILIMQSYFDVPQIIRRNLTGLCLFPISSGLDIIFKDVRSYFRDKKEFDKLVAQVILSGNQHNSLFISYEPGLDPVFRVRKNFKFVRKGLYADTIALLRLRDQASPVLRTSREAKPTTSSSPKNPKV